MPMAVNKVVAGFDEAVADVQNEAVLLIGGFGGPGECPSYLISAVHRRGLRDLIIVGNSGGWGMDLIELIRTRMASLLKFPLDFVDPGLLVETGQVKKGILAFPAAPSPLVQTPFERGVASGDLVLELVPQGTLAERIRAGRAGIPAFYTPTGPGTIAAEGKESREFDGRTCLLERAIYGDFSLIRAHKADRYGNLVYKGTSRTFNATMAGASKVTIAEVDEVVEVGELDPEAIVTPGLYVQRVVVRPESAKDAS
jgi:3-oxoacid CoA-transferase A subunit